MNRFRKDYFTEKPARSSATMTTIKARVTAATPRRVPQLMPRLTHHNSAQLMMTGTVISSGGNSASRLLGS